MHSSAQLRSVNGRRFEVLIVGAKRCDELGHPYVAAQLAKGLGGLVELSGQPAQTSRRLQIFVTL
jgi:hypothetical protein